ncbi:MAG: hypothetical protein R2767_05450 [Chitinophagales bacterium]|nr:hypothetical protein [Chitinophagales bacterium]HQU39536.1 hypothetical protein [Chitinophagales bacterium]HRX24719.1 hypothetical protein [Chitinophagales bacterium]
MMNILSKFLGGGKSGGGADRVAAFIGAMEKDLHLDAQQKTAVEQALRQFMQDRKSAKQSGNKDAMKDGRDQFREAISAILRDDQEKIFAGKFQEYKQLLKG